MTYIAYRCFTRIQKNYVNTYLIHAPERSLLIDTGSRDDESFFSLEYLLFHLSREKTPLGRLSCGVSLDVDGGNGCLLTSSFDEE